MVADVTSTTDTSLSATLVGLLKQADTNGDGIVSKSELETAMGSDNSLASQVVSAADTDGDGAMSATEFASFADKFSTQTGMTLLAAQESAASVASLYADLDTDGSGSLTATEISTAIGATDAGSDTTATEDGTSEETTSADTTASDTTTTSTYAGWTVDDLLKTVDATGDGVYNKDDEAKRVLDADDYAQRKHDSLTQGESLDDLLYDVRQALEQAQASTTTSA